MADFGLTEDTYGANYFRRRKSVTGSEEKVPIKWMAPESIENDIYNERTDVVSNLYLVHTLLKCKYIRHLYTPFKCMHDTILNCFFT